MSLWKCEECGAGANRLAQNHTGAWVCITQCILLDPTLTPEQTHFYERKMVEEQNRKLARKQARGGAQHGLATP